MTSHSTTSCLPQSEIETTGRLFDNWFDPIEAGLRDRAREFLQAMFEAELDEVLARSRYDRRGRRVTVRRRTGRHRSPPRPSVALAAGDVRGGDDRGAARAAEHLRRQDDRVEEPSAAGLSAAHAARADALIAGAYLAGTNTRRVRRALGALFGGAVGKDTVSRIWRKVKSDWDAWMRARWLTRIVRLILDGTVVRVRLDRKATSISLLVVARRAARRPEGAAGGQDMGGESEAAWRALLDDLVARGLPTPELVIVDGAAGLEKALAALWPDVLMQRCTVHKHRNLLAHAPERLHEEISADYNDMIYAGTREEIETRRKSFIRKWRLKCRAVADSLEEAGDRLFTFTRLPPSQWRSARTTNAIERLHEEFKRRIKTQTVLPSAETAAMLFWALLASGQITMRKVDGWQTLAEKPTDQSIDLAA